MYNYIFILIYRKKTFKNLETTSNSASVISTYSDVISSKTDVSKSDTLKYTDTIFTEIAESNMIYYKIKSNMKN